MKATLFVVKVQVLILAGAAALAGGIVFFLNKADETAAREPDGGTPHRAKRTLTAMARDPETKGSSSDSKDDRWRNALTGTWRVLYGEDGTCEVTYSPDGRMSGQITLKTGKQQELVWSGKWDVRDGRLCEEIEESDTPELLPAGRKTKDKILEVKEKEFRSFDAEVSETVIWHRVE
jgi:hypothetical protein